MTTVYKLVATTTGEQVHMSVGGGGHMTLCGHLAHHELPTAGHLTCRHCRMAAEALLRGRLRACDAIANRAGINLTWELYSQ